ncbi:helix-turn-helix domain-containing protein [Aliiroseovarius subalbicans]|uniref:helix-turn-helix domain-containing protein n=1 Tax=Aliiroseovarius subalbicans TaxID=2925840 RepID=UPI001F5603E1|nr:helix-turn-helix domain-containing protein [Aliiroseovarius subalbicans]MCI2397869.1 helix-turn-helix domain-containing protein [Aliiroseovarius subalbicans]
MDDDGWYSNDTATFGDRVAGAREAEGMSQEALARRLGVKLKTVKGWEDDLAEPRANKLQMLSGVLGVSLMWLLTGEGDGVDEPEEVRALTPEVKDILLEVRSLKTQITASADKLGRLEKALRKTLERGAL